MNISKVKLNSKIMKRFVYAALCVVSLCLSGCGYDDDEVWNAINDQEERIAALEEWQKTANENIAALQAIVNGNDYITSVEEIKEGDEIIGYTINFHRQGEVTIYNGKDGEKGDMPVIGVSEGEDGRWYWTVNGELMEDADGNPVCASGKDGEDGEDGEDGQDGSSYTGVTPIIKLGSDLGDGYNQYASYLSVDGGKTWTQMNVTLGWGGSILEAIYDYGEYYYFQFGQGDTHGILIPKYGNGLSFIFHEDGATYDYSITNGKQTVPQGGSFWIRVQQNSDSGGEWTYEVVDPDTGKESSSWKFTQEGILLVCDSAPEGSAILKFTYVDSDNSVTYYQITLTSYETGTISNTDNPALVTALADALGTSILNEDGDVEITSELIQNTTHLYITNYNITSLKGIEAFVNLEVLNCSDNPLTSLDVSAFSELRELYCVNCFSKSSQSRSYENGVLDLSANTKLQALSCGNNGLTELILPDSPLKNIYCNNNQLKSLDLSKNESLEFVNCEYNQIEEIDLSKNVALIDFHATGNQLSQIDLTANTQLTSLSLYDNDFTALEVSANVNLQYLSCGSNELTSLDVSKNTNLTSLSCESNRMLTLNVSANTQLEFLNCGDQRTADDNEQQLILTINESQQALWESSWEGDNYNVVLADGLVHSSGGSGSNFGNGGVY